MGGLLDTLVIRLPRGHDARTLSTTTRRSAPRPAFDLEGFGFEPATDDEDEATLEPSEIRVERVEASEDDLRMLREEPETVGTVLTMMYDHVQPASDADGLDGDAADTGPLTWGLRRIGVSNTTELTGKGVTVAVLDTGIDTAWRSHPAFAGRNIEAQNFTSEDAGDWGDHDGHGTHCAGTIFGGTVDGRRIGVAPGVNKALVGKVLGPRGGTTDSLFRGMQWAAANRADIISMSLAVNFDATRQRLVEDFGRAPAEATSLTLRAYRENFTLFDRLSLLFQTPGMRVTMPTVVVATGNESKRPDYTIEAAPPAVAQWFLSVNATAKDDSVAPFSNTGGQISAPGVGILSAALGGGLRTDSGTSMAAPHVAGAAALWIEHLQRDGQRVSNDDVQDALFHAAQPLGSALGNPEDLGKGLIRIPQTQAGDVDS